MEKFLFQELFQRGREGPKWNQLPALDTTLGDFFFFAHSANELDFFYDNSWISKAEKFKEEVSYLVLFLFKE